MFTYAQKQIEQRRPTQDECNITLNAQVDNKSNSSETTFLRAIKRKFVSLAKFVH